MTTPFPLRPLWLTALAVAMAAGCGDDTATPQAASTIAVASQVATPTPRAIATPRLDATPEVALPTPLTLATPAPVPSPTPTPVGAEGTATEGAAPEEDYRKTGRALDLAVSGPAYFVLSTKAAPESVEDLLFTRLGALTFEKDTQGAIQVYRLRHADHAFHAVGFRLAGAGETAPLEVEGGAIATTWMAGTLSAAGLAVDADRNPDAAGKAAFDYTGRLRIAEADPRAPEGGPMAAYVALAQFASPEGLQAQPGFDGVYRYRPEAGTMRLGVAVSGEGRPLGSANLILTGTLEQGD